MNVVKVMGGLGNQMFQYAFARLIGAGLDISFYDSDENHTEKIPPREFLLDKFNCQYELIDPEGLPEVSEEKYTEGCQDSYLVGYWQKPGWYAPIFHKLKEELTLKPEFIPQYLKSLAEEISSCNSVAVHVRRGDYVALGHVLPPDYFNDAIREYQETETCPVYYVFSDDPDWCMENITIPCGKYQVHKDYEDWYLMTHAKHVIMSNSSYSFMGFYLGEALSCDAPEDWRGIPSIIDAWGLK